MIQIAAALVVLIAASLAASGVAAQQSQATHAMTWEEAGLKFSDLQHYFNTPACEHRPRAMLGCLFAIESLLTGLNPPMQIGFDVDAIARIVEHHRHNADGSRHPGAVKLGSEVMPHNFEGPLRLEPASENTLLAHRARPHAGESHKAFYQRRNAAIVTRLEELSRHTASRAAITWQSLIASALDMHLSENRVESRAEFAANLINLQLRIGKTPHDQISTDGMAFGPQRESSGFYGLGFEMQIHEDDSLHVSRVNKGGPAQRSGVKAGDRIVSIDGWKWDEDALPIGERVEKAMTYFLRNEPAAASLQVVRGGDTLSFEVPRMHVENLRLEHEVLRRHDRAFLYLGLSRFPSAGSVCALFAQIVGEHPHAHGWILDLRRNAGGNLNTVTCLTGILLEPGQIIFYEEEAGGELTPRAHTPGVRSDPRAELSGDDRPPTPALQVEPLAVQKPLVVLLDYRSASGSELMAAALQDHGRAWIVGERSFGKGTEQIGAASASNPHIWSWRDIKTFYRPAKSTIQLNGVQPDFEVFPDPAATEMTAERVREKDMFFNPVVAANNPPWRNARLDEIERIGRCAGGLAGNAITRWRDDATIDFQLETALDVAACAVE